MKRRTPKSRISLSRRMIPVILCCLLLLSAFPVSAYAETLSAQQELLATASAMLSYDHAPGELLVSFPPEVSVAQAEDALVSALGSDAEFELIFNCRESKPDSVIIYCVEVAPGEETSAMAALSQHPHTLHVEPNYTVEIESPSMETMVSAFETVATASVEDSPYDPEYQWALDMIGVADAWASGFVGSADVKVGIIDTGIVNHADLDAHIDWELAYNCGDSNASAVDTEGHGTFVSGIIGAELNDIGTVGACQNITLVPLKNHANNWTMHIAGVVSAVWYAIDQEIDILNCSMKLPEVDVTSNSALRFALQCYDGLFITTAGNNDIDMSNDSYTALKRHNDPNWIVVGGSNADDELYSDSNYSALYCDLFAPGENIKSTAINGGYRSGNGTSFAAPYVTAAAALIMSHAPHLTPLEVKALLMETVDVKQVFTGKCVSNGRLSIINAVNQLYTENRGAYSLGDVNGDGYITSADATLARQIVMNAVTPSVQQLSAIDVNKDGTINIADYSLINRFVLRTNYFSPV